MKLLLLETSSTDPYRNLALEEHLDVYKRQHFSFESIAMILIGFTCTGTFQLWLNCAQNFAKENVGWADPSIMQTYYSAGTLIALDVYKRQQ